MKCKECIYFDHDHHCGKHMTFTEATWRCSSGIEQDNRTPEEVENDVKRLEKEIQSKVHGQHPVELDPIHGERKSLLESTFGLSTPDMLGIYKIDEAGKLEVHDCELMSRSKVEADKAKLQDIIDKLSDPVNHPSHYTDGSIEVIDFIEDKKLPYHLGNAVKYICRAGKKDPTKTTEDLEKCVWYINRYIKTLEK